MKIILNFEKWNKEYFSGEMIIAAIENLLEKANEPVLENKKSELPLLYVFRLCEGFEVTE